jgi:hypothetical protein
LLAHFFQSRQGKTCRVEFALSGESQESFRKQRSRRQFVG